MDPPSQDGHGSLWALFFCPLPPVGRLLSWEDVNGDGRADVLGEAKEGQGLWVGLGSSQGKWRPRLYALGGVGACGGWTRTRGAMIYRYCVFVDFSTNTEI
ncbi:hypothetical protein CYFUS_009349 [Cystobacter fuscus]|uniref:Uncharacterized protein n=1 Tax=Cystobacter fuscus TaxID=43 RepID=A0A250JJS1_9BACT|nr:hypothetical protein [Cystobacter fuscus]ATB43868.1 hypothetical protein CYFUS_009349 [Cystobacter fuscus]